MLRPGQDLGDGAGIQTDVVVALGVPLISMTVPPMAAVRQRPGAVSCRSIRRLTAPIFIIAWLISSQGDCRTGLSSS